MRVPELESQQHGPATWTRSFANWWSIGIVIKSPTKWWKALPFPSLPPVPLPVVNMESLTTVAAHGPKLGATQAIARHSKNCAPSSSEHIFAGVLRRGLTGAGFAKYSEIYRQSKPATALNSDSAFTGQRLSVKSNVCKSIKSAKSRSAAVRAVATTAQEVDVSGFMPYSSLLFVSTRSF